MKLLFIICVILSFLSTNTYADEASHRAAAEELIHFSKPDKTLKQVWVQIRSMLEQQYHQIGAPEDLRPIFKKYNDKMFKVLEEELSYKNNKDAIIKIYVNTYTESELRAISNFYKTPAGKALLEKTPKIIQASMALNQKKMPHILQKINSIKAEMMEELKKQINK